MMTELTIVTPPSELVVSVAFVRDDHLRAPNGSVEDDWIEQAVRTATRMGERDTHRSWVPQTLALKLDHFPCGSDDIRLPRPPIIEVDSITYVDVDGVTQTLNDSLYALQETGRDVQIDGRIALAPDQVWPETQSGKRQAVTVTYRAGYVAVGSPETVDVPEDLIHGVLLVVGELYKQRSLSVHAMNQNQAVITARGIWSGYTVY